MDRKIILTLAAAIVALFPGACTSTVKSAGKPVPEMSFVHMAPFFVDASNIDIETLYDPMADRKDVSSTFPTPPDIALRRYAENRLKPSASSRGTLRFVIEDARVDYTNIKVQGHFATLIRDGGKDRYDVRIKLRLYKVMPDSGASKQITLTLERPLTLPESMSVAEREMAQFRFLEQMMRDVDAAVVNVLQNSLHLGVPYDDFLSPPELGREQY